MTLFGRSRSPREVPDDSPDLAYTMSLVTSVGGLAAYWTRRSTLGMASGLGVGAAFALGGWWIQNTADPDKHELAHQICLISSVLFGGAMGYRAGSNPYVGPGGSMLAALGTVSSAYHLKKMLEWRSYEQSRVEEAERLLRQYQYKHPGDMQAQERLGGALTPPQPGGPPAFGGPALGGSAIPGDSGRPPRPQLERRTPVPPGGF